MRGDFAVDNADIHSDIECHDICIVNIVVYIKHEHNNLSVEQHDNFYVVINDGAGWRDRGVEHNGGQLR